MRWRAGAWRIVADGGRTPDGKRRQVWRTVKAPNNRLGRREAESALAKLVVEVEAGRVQASTGLTVGQLLERWVEHRRPGWEERSPGQPDATLARIRQHIVPAIGDVRVDRLRPADIDAMYAKWRQSGGRKGQGLSESTVRRMHDILHAALGQAVRWDLRVDNPADRVDKPTPKKRRVTAPSDEVCKALIAAAPPSMLAYLRLAAITGARRGQLVGLRWPALNLDGCEVTFTEALAKVKGGVAVKGTKSDVDYTVALDPVTVEIVKAHRRRCAERALAAGSSLLAEGYVFAQDSTPDGRLPWHPDGANQRFAKVRQEVGKKVPAAKAITPHQFRHWLASALFSEGYDPIEVASRGGWRSAALPLSVYGHRSPARDRQAAADLAARLDG